MIEMDTYFDTLLPETKRALDSLLAEFGATLPADFAKRMLKLSPPYTSYTVICGAAYADESSVVDYIKNIIANANSGNPVENIACDTKYLMEKLDSLVDFDEVRKAAKLPPLISRVRVVQPISDNVELVLAMLPDDKVDRIVINDNCRIDIEINGKWEKRLKLKLG